MLKIHTKQLRTVAVLGLQGQLVNGQTELLRTAAQSLSEVNLVKLDLARMTTVDAAGLGVMLELRARLEARGIRLELLNVSRQIRRVLQLTRLDTVFPMTPLAEVFPAGRHQRQARSLRAGSRSQRPLASCA